jgi:hypothetical protein
LAGCLGSAGSEQRARDQTRLHGVTTIPTLEGHIPVGTQSPFVMTSAGGSLNSQHTCVLSQRCAPVAQLSTAQVDGICRTTQYVASLPSQSADDVHDFPWPVET